MRNQGRTAWLGLAVVLVLGVLFFGFTFWLYGVVKTVKRSVVRIANKEVDLQRAAKAAQGTLPKFTERLEHPSPGDKFAIKGRFKTPVGPEYLWLKDPKFVKGEFVGTLDQKPIAYSAKMGDQLHVKPPDVYDWMVRRADGSMAGGFTEIALGKGQP